MEKGKGFTLIEILIATVIFSMVVGLAFYAFTQGVSLWDRTEREIEKLNRLALANHWLKELFHSAENLPVYYKNKFVAIFVGNKEKVIFLSSNPIINENKIISLIKLEIKNESLYYAEQNLFLEELADIKRLEEISFKQDEYLLLAGIKDGRISYLYKENGEQIWSDEFDSEKNNFLPFAVKISFLYEGEEIIFMSDILSDKIPRGTLQQIIRW